MMEMCCSPLLSPPLSDDGATGKSHPAVSHRLSQLALIVQLSYDEPRPQEHS